MSSSDRQDIDRFLNTDGLERTREKEIGQHIGYRYDVNLLPDYARLTPFLRNYMELMGWDDLNWLEDVHMGYGISTAGSRCHRIFRFLTISRTATCLPGSS